MVADSNFRLTCLEPVIYHYDDKGVPTIMYPCGKCIVCKEKKRRQWAVRMENEKAYSKSVFFVTLTYEDSFLYRKDSDLPPSLSKRHYHNFLSTLRKKLPFKFRMFGVGEYGTVSSRPHYHFMIFCPEWISLNEFRSYVSSSWKYGFNTVKDGTSTRMYYIAKYTVKGSSHPFGTEKPFQTSSQRPPIGFRSFEDNYSLLDCDFSRNYIVSPSNRKSSIPRSFERRYKQRLNEDFGRSNILPPSELRKSVLQKRAGARLRSYLNTYNRIPPVELINMRDNIERRYNKKHKKLTNI